MACYPANSRFRFCSRSSDKAEPRRRSRAKKPRPAERLSFSCVHTRRLCSALAGWCHNRWLSAERVLPSCKQEHRAGGSASTDPARRSSRCLVLCWRRADPSSPLQTSRFRPSVLDYPRAPFAGARRRDVASPRGRDSPLPAESGSAAGATTTRASEGGWAWMGLRAGFRWESWTTGRFLSLCRRRYAAVTVLDNPPGNTPSPLSSVQSFSPCNGIFSLRIFLCRACVRSGRRGKVDLEGEGLWCTVMTGVRCPPDVAPDALLSSLHSRCIHTVAGQKLETRGEKWQDENFAITRTRSRL